MTSFFWSTLLLVATGAIAPKEFSYDVILFGVPCYWLLQVLQLARSSSMTSFFWSSLLLVAAGATARKEFFYDVSRFRVLCYWFLQVLLVQQVATSLAVLSSFAEIVVTQLFSSMTSFFWSTLLLVATGATARKEFIYDVILLEYLATGCYRCYSSQGVHL